MYCKYNILPPPLSYRDTEVLAESCPLAELTPQGTTAAAAACILHMCINIPCKRGVGLQQRVTLPHIFS